MKDVFYLHEDEWAQIEILPIDNMERVKEVGAEGQAFSDAHFDGGSWSAIYVRPSTERPISELGIALEELRALIGGRLEEAKKIDSGTYSDVGSVKNGFAFCGDFAESGAFYGLVDDGLIRELNMLTPDWEDARAVDLFTDVLGEMGKRYGLMLADWWLFWMVDLRDGEAVKAYLLRYAEGNGEH